MASPTEACCAFRRRTLIILGFAAVLLFAPRAAEARETANRSLSPLLPSDGVIVDLDVGPSYVAVSLDTVNAEQTYGVERDDEFLPLVLHVSTQFPRGKRTLALMTVDPADNKRLISLGDKVKPHAPTPTPVPTPVETPEVSRRSFAFQSDGPRAVDPYGNTGGQFAPPPAPGQGGFPTLQGGGFAPQAPSAPTAGTSPFGASFGATAPPPAMGQPGQAASPFGGFGATAAPAAPGGLGAPGAPGAPPPVAANPFAMGGAPPMGGGAPPAAPPSAPPSAFLGAAPASPQIAPAAAGGNPFAPGGSAASPPPAQPGMAAGASPFGGGGTSPPTGNPFAMGGGGAPPAAAPAATTASPPPGNAPANPFAIGASVQGATP